MKRAVVIASDHRLMSALVDSDTARTLHVGDSVRVSKAVELEDGCIPIGETATVLTVDRDAGGYVEILFDRPIAALHEWRNVLLLVPFDTPEYISGLSLVSCYEQKELHRSWKPKDISGGRCLAVAAVVVAFVIGWCLEPPQDFLSPGSAQAKTLLHSSVNWSTPKACLPVLDESITCDI